MRTLGPLLLGLLVGLVVGAGVMKLLAEAPVALPWPESGGSARVVRADDESVSFPVAPPAAAIEAERVAVSHSVEAPASVLLETARVARSAPRPARASGDKAIRGRVTRSGGLGVEGVVVRAQRHHEEPVLESSQLGGAPPPSETLDRAIEEAVVAWYRASGGEIETTTDRDGHYEMTGLLPGSWSVQAWVRGFEVASRGECWVEPDATVDFVAKPVARLPIAIALPDGREAPRAAVEWRRAGSQRDDCERALWTPTDRELPLLAGRWEVRATLGSPGGGPEWEQLLASGWSAVTIAEAVAPSPLRLALTGARGIRGSVQLSEGWGTDALVHLVRAPGGADLDLKELFGEVHERRSEPVDGDGYLFMDVEPGTWVVGLSRTWRGAVVAHAVVEVADTMVVHDFVAPPLDASLLLLARVLAADGEPVDDVAFALEVERGNGSSSGGVDAQRRPDGAWSVPLDSFDMVDLSREWKEDVVVTLTVSSDEFGSRSIELEPGARQVEVRFLPPARLLATIVGYAGSGREGKLDLALDRSIGDGEFEDDFGGSGGIAVDGTRTFEALEPGVWRLRLTLASEEWWDRRTLAVVEVALASGDNAATVAIPALFDVAVDVGDRDGWMVLRSESTDEQLRSEVKDGRVAFEGIVAGDYALQSWGRTHEMMRLRVPVAGPLRFAPLKIDAWRVELDDDGELERFGFRKDDRIVGIDGQEFESGTQMQGLLLLALGKSEVVCEVDRGGTRVKVTASPQALQAAQHSGELAPTAR